LSRLVQSTLGPERRAQPGLREVACAKALSLSRLPGLTYALNPYIGCSHGCPYCYSQDVLRLGARGPWGSWVDAKLGIAQRLAREMRRAKPGTVGLGTVTDPYQRAEGEHQLARECLEVLAEHDHPICIQTKSNLVVRDVDLIGKQQSAEVGFTVTTLDESVRARIEPGAPTSAERCEAARALSDAGIKVWTFLGPIVWGLNDSDESVRSVVRASADAGARKLLFDFYRPKPLANERMSALLGGEFSARKHRSGAETAARDACAELGIVFEPAFQR
jgi:DNA repair photolyase